MPACLFMPITEAGSHFGDHYRTQLHSYNWRSGLSVPSTHRCPVGNFTQLKETFNHYSPHCPPFCPLGRGEMKVRLQDKESRALGTVGVKAWLSVVNPGVREALLTDLDLLPERSY